MLQGEGLEEEKPPATWTETVWREGGQGWGAPRPGAAGQGGVKTMCWLNGEWTL